MGVRHKFRLFGKDIDRAARFFVWALRHEPVKAGISLDREGWVRVADLIAVARPGKSGARIDRDAFDGIVRTDSKQRLEVSSDGQRVRAAQGHSVAIDLSRQRAAPPVRLYHGTATQHLDAIRQSGLDKASRQHVHLSADLPTAAKVGARHGTPVILPVLAAELATTGAEFFLASNGVWLCGHVPTRFIDWDGLIYQAN